MKIFATAVIAVSAFSTTIANACGVAGDSDAVPRPMKNTTRRPTTKPTTAPPATIPVTTPSASPVATSPAAPSTGSTGSWWKPTPGTAYQIQLSGTLDLSPKVQMFDLDLFDTDAATIAALKTKGVRVVCYFSAGTYENWRSDKNLFTSDMYGKALPEWEGEFWLDTRNAKLREIIKTRMALAKEKGCDAVDPDNVDGAFNDSGFPLTAATQLDYNTFLATTAHGLGLAVGLKNDLAQIEQLAPVFDFAVNEQCYQYRECAKLTPFIKLNKPVFGIEYEGAKAPACKQANELKFDTLFKSLDLKNERYSCRENA